MGPQGSSSRAEMTFGRMLALLMHEAGVRRIKVDGRFLAPSVVSGWINGAHLPHDGEHSVASITAYLNDHAGHDICGNDLLLAYMRDREWKRAPSRPKTSGTAQKQSVEPTDFLNDSHLIDVSIAKQARNTSTRIRRELHSGVSTFDKATGQLPTAALLYARLFTLIEYYLLQALTAEHNESLFNPATALEYRRYGLFHNGVRYFVDMGTIPGRPLEAHCAIRGSPAATSIAETLILDTAGRFSTAVFEIDKRLTSSRESLRELFRVSLDTGDRFIDEWLVSSIASLNSAKVSELYGYIRAVVPSQLAKAIRLYLLSPESGGGMFFDTDSAKASIERLRTPDTATDPEPLGPTERVLRLAVTRFPTRESVAAEIIPDLRTVVRSPLAIPSGSRVGTDQLTLFAGDLVLQPLVNDDQLWIEAGYPADRRTLIEPILLDVQDDFREVARRLDLAREVTTTPYDQIIGRTLVQGFSDEVSFPEGESY